MRFCLPSGTALRLLSLPVMLLSLGGCQTILGRTLTEGTSAAVVTDVCRAWRPVTYSSRDTAQTQTEARANNAAREAFGCRKTR